MKNLTLCLAVLFLGCSERGNDKTYLSSASTADMTRTGEANQPAAKILRSLKSNNRNTVHVALWTLKDNQIETPVDLDFQMPFSVAAEYLDDLSVSVANLGNARLVELDKSLDDHWQIYSPIWGPTSETWE